jgi:FkbM family methyltransferase
MPIEEFWLANSATRAVAAMGRRGLAIDVGANKGEWTLELAAAFNKVIAFEPDSRVRDGIALPPNCDLRSEAVCEYPGVARFYLRPDAGQNSLLEDHPIGAGGQSAAPVIESVDVPTTSLDLAAPDGADFVKIDVEGAEVLVLRGCKNLQGWSRTFFIVECHNTRPAVAEELWRLGKRVSLVRHIYASAHPGHCWLIGEPEA